MATRSEILKCLTVLAAKIPNAKPSGMLMDAYVDSLTHIPIDVLDASLAQGLVSWTFFPSLAEIFTVISSLSSSMSLLPTPGDAWGLVLQQIRKAGFYRQPQFECELVARTVENIGWAYLCSSEDEMADRAHFMKMYDQAKSRAEQDAKLLPKSLAMRESLRLQTMDGREPKRLKPVEEQPKELISAPSEVLEMIKLLSQRMGAILEPVPFSETEPEAFARMICDTCNRKVDSRMGWEFGELCNLPLDGDMRCEGRMIERPVSKEEAA